MSVTTSKFSLALFEVYDNVPLALRFGFVLLCLTWFFIMSMRSGTCIDGSDEPKWEYEEEAEEYTEAEPDVKQEY